VNRWQWTRQRWIGWSLYPTKVYPQVTTSV